MRAYIFALTLAGFTLSASAPGQATAQQLQLQTGDVLVVRTPWSPVTAFSYWTHVAIYDGRGGVIEAMPGGPVRRTALANFWAAYPQIRVQRLRVNSGVLGPRMVAYAAAQVGRQPYQIIPMFRGMDCVELVRQSFIFSIGDWRVWWLLPDQVAYDQRFAVVGGK